MRFIPNRAHSPLLSGRIPPGIPLGVPLSQPGCAVSVWALYSDSGFFSFTSSWDTTVRSWPVWLAAVLRTATAGWLAVQLHGLVHRGLVAYGCARFSTGTEAGGGAAALRTSTTSDNLQSIARGESKFIAGACGCIVHCALCCTSSALAAVLGRGGQQSDSLGVAGQARRRSQPGPWRRSCCAAPSCSSPPSQRRPAATPRSPNPAPISAAGGAGPARHLEPSSSDRSSRSGAG